jgi:hypothetical protein
VAGVYSTRPGFVGGQPVGGAQEGDIPLAVVGVVPVKASAEGGAIRPGDLLTTAATPGHAMKAGPNPAVGTVIGKALEPLAPAFKPMEALWLGGVLISAWVVLVIAVLRRVAEWRRARP